MRCSTVLPFALLALVHAAPLPHPQLAGEGAACDSILSSTDNGVGYGTENALDNLSQHARRQLAGEGSACNSILSSTDNGVGYGTENALDNTAGAIKSAGARRQLDKISNGAQTVSQAAGTGDLTAPATTGLDGVDGTSTSAAADLGAEVGSAEEGTLEGVGKAVP